MNVGIVCLSPTFDQITCRKDGMVVSLRLSQIFQSLLNHFLIDLSGDFAYLFPCLIAKLQTYIYYEQEVCEAAICAHLKHTPHEYYLVLVIGCYMRLMVFFYLAATDGICYEALLCYDSKRVCQSQK